ncbi:MAG: PilZ domain-containing protein [Planctomycetota bacterium]
MKGWVSRQDASKLINGAIKATFSKDDAPSDRRRHRRIKATGAVTCNLGRVLDISGGGLRVLSKTKTEGQGRVELTSVNLRVAIPARVVWCHKVGFRKYVMGLEFMNLTPELMQRVTEIATAA